MADIERDELDAIFGRSILTAEVFAAELRRRLVREIAELRDSLSQPALIELAREILEDFEPLLAQSLTDAEVAASIAGVNSVARLLPTTAETAFAATSPLQLVPPGPPVDPTLVTGGGDPVVRFPLIERAAESLAERRIVTRSDFDLLAREARAQAFTVARQDSLDALETIRNALSESIAEGTSLCDFRRRLGDDLDGSFIGPAHRETVFRTNVQAAFHQAHDELAGNPIVEEIFPYQAYFPINDGRVRDEHLALASLGLDGTNVYRRDDPMWSLFTPPWSWNCRCGVQLLTIEAAARKGVTEAARWLRTGEPPQQPEHRIAAIPFRPNPHFVGPRSRAA